VTGKPPKFNDRIITDGFPPRWHVQDRLDEGTALLCRKGDAWLGGSRCVCVRPKVQPTDEWLPTARIIAFGFEREERHRLEARLAEIEKQSFEDKYYEVDGFCMGPKT
jgi:hypothetical protein